MTKINDGGPAFGCGVMPHPTEVTKSVPVAGLTVRDWFAGQALSAIAKNREALSYATVGVEAAQWMAKQAYDLADALLAERSKSQGQEP